MTGDLAQEPVIFGRSDSFRYAPDTNGIAAEVRQDSEAWSTCRTLSEVYLQMAGTLLSAKEPIAPTTTYRVLTGFQMAETVPMNSGRTKVAAMATAFLEGECDRPPHVIWHSRVSTSIVWRLDRMTLSELTFAGRLERLAGFSVVFEAPGFIAGEHFNALDSCCNEGNTVRPVLAAQAVCSSMPLDSPVRDSSVRWRDTTEPNSRRRMCQS